MNSSIAAKLVSLLLLWVPVSVQGLPTGAPSTACNTFTPQHGVSTQSSQVPYALSMSGLLTEGSQMCYVPNEIYNITLNLTDTDLPFKGFLIMAQSWSTATGTGTGRFLSFDTGLVQYASCGPTEASVTHTSNVDKIQLTFAWKAPPIGTGSIQFRWTVVQVYTTFWSNNFTPLLCEATVQTSTVSTQQPTTTSSTQSLSATSVIDVPAGGVCEEYSLSLYGNYTNFYGNVAVITGIPLMCINGQYTALCNDSTTDPSSASALCTLYGFYGGGMYVCTYGNTPKGTVFASNFSCPYYSSLIDECGVTQVPVCDNCPFGLSCYITEIAGPIAPSSTTSFGSSTPTVTPTTTPPTTSATENSVIVTLSSHTTDTFDEHTQLTFRIATSQSVNNFCSTNPDQCEAVADKGRRLSGRIIQQLKRQDEMVSADAVIITDMADTREGMEVTFYVQQINGVLPGTALADAVQAGVDDGTYMGAGFIVTSVESLTSPSTNGLLTNTLIGIIVGAVAGGIIIIILIIASICFCIWCMRKSDKGQYDFMDKDIEFTIKNVSYDASATGSVQSLRLTFSEEAGESESKEGSDGSEKKMLEDGEETHL